MYKGTVLQSGSIQDCGIGEDDFLVVVVIRASAAAVPPAETASAPSQQASLRAAVCVVVSSLQLHHFHVSTEFMRGRDLLLAIGDG